MDHLLKGRVATVAAAEVGERLSARSGNRRETLFDLYDLYERRRPRELYAKLGYLNGILASLSFALGDHAAAQAYCATALAAAGEVGHGRLRGAVVSLALFERNDEEEAQLRIQ